LVGSSGATGLLGVAELCELAAAVGAMPPSRDDTERIDRVRQFEALKSAIAAAQASETAAFVTSQRAAQAAAGVPVDQQNRGIASQIALARRCSLHAAQRYTGWSVILVRELPETLAALRAGRTSEHRAMTIAKATLFLSREDRSTVDQELAPRLDAMSDRAVEVESAKAAYRLDPEGSLARSRRAASERCVSIRPAPDTMVRVSGLLPVAQGVACYAALSRAADTASSDGDARSRGQVMADTFVERLTGQTEASAVPVEIELVVDIETLFDRPDAADPSADDTTANDPTEDDRPSSSDREAPRPRNEAGLVTAAGLAPTPVPAGVARDLVMNAPQARLRRLFTRPATGELVAMETHRRLFTEGQRRFIRLRDQYCATPWCGAPIRHADHITPAARGGPTRLDNGRGLCQACNHSAQAPGWRSTALPDGTIETVTPTGQSYRRPPPRPFSPPNGGADPSAAPNTAPDRIGSLQRAHRLASAA
jgi:hypothetical protein